MILLDWSHTAPHLHPYMALSHSCHLMILLRHPIFPVQRERFRPLPLSIPSSSRSWAILCLTAQMNFGSWKGHLMVLKRGNQWKHFWRTCTSPTIRRPYVPTANHWRRYYDVPIQSSSSSPTATTVPVLPHPEHSNVYVSQPYEAIPDHLHTFAVMLGTLCPTPLSRNHHLFILATLAVYTTFFPTGNTTTYGTSHSPRCPSSTSTWSTGCERYGPYGYVGLQCVIYHIICRPKKEQWFTGFLWPLTRYTFYLQFPTLWALLFGHYQPIPQLGLSALFSTLDIRRHGSFFSAPSISRYIHEWDTAGYTNLWMVCWTSRPSWWCEPSSKPTCSYLGWLLSPTGIDSPQRTWPWTLHGYG